MINKKIKNYHQKSNFACIKIREFFFVGLFAFYVVTNLANIYENCPNLKLLCSRKNVAEMNYHDHHLHFAETIWWQSQWLPDLETTRPEWRPLSSQPVITC